MGGWTSRLSALAARWGRVSIRAKTFVLVFAALLALVVTVSALASRIVLQGFEQIEAENVRAHVGRVGHALREKVQAVQTLAQDYAQWDYTHDYLADRSPAFLDANLSLTTIRDLAVDVVVIADLEGRSVYDTLYDPDADALRPLPDSLRIRLLGTALRKVARDGKARRGLVVLPEGALLLAVEPVLRTDESGPMRGTLAMGRWLEPKVLTQLRDDLGLPVELLRTDTQGDAVADAMPLFAGEGDARTRVVSHHVIEGLGRIDDARGAPALLIRLTLPRTIMAHARSSVWSMLAAVAMVGVAVLLLASFVLERLLLRRVAAMSARVAAIRTPGPDGGAVGTSDELGQLSRAIDTMLGSLTAYTDGLEEAKAAAENANRTKSAFVAAVTHDLRTPLHGILGYAELLRDDALAKGDVDGAENLERLRRSGRYLLDLVNDVLDVARMEAGRFELHPEPIDVPRLMRELTEEMAYLAEEGGNRLELDCADDWPALALDPVRIRQIAVNFLSNACKFTENGTIVLRARLQAGRLELAVRDSGAGMTDEERARVFEAFYQANAGAARGDGTGLGLAITHRLVEAMEGTITVESAPGRGSTFCASLPVRPAWGWCPDDAPVPSAA